jgi:NADH-quinone oxidoreductase subunit L
MPGFLEHQPGLLFVAATLLPVASFLVILLGFAVNTFVRKRSTGTGAGHGHDDEHAPGDAGPSRIPAYIATAAIALAFVCSITGCVLYINDHETLESKELRLEAQIQAARAKRHHSADPKEAAALGEKIEKMEEDLHVIKAKWSGHVTWAAVHPISKEMAALQREITELREKTPVDANEADRLAAERKEKEQELKELTDHQAGTILTLGFRIDTLSALMFVMVTFIATLIHLFSMGYMAEELHVRVADHHVHTAEGHLHRRGRFGRFFLFLSLFCFSMLNLILADNLFQVFVSWELVGVCSYLLIGFYFERQSASNAANKAFITNRVGDAGFIIGLLIIWTNVGTFNFEEIFQRVRAPMTHAHGTVELAGQIVRVEPKANQDHKYTVLPNTHSLGIDTQAMLFPLEQGDHPENVKAGQTVTIGTSDGGHERVQYAVMPYWMLVAAGLGIFLGCVGKSAQFPLQVWLPDAMEGPTPVSALIHAATMVAAGVYLVGRCFPLFTWEVLLVIAYTGGITCFLAASIALVMTDIKKVLAYSTVSQLGYMMLALGVGGWAAGLFHLYTHAFFKALLFLGSGSVIYGCHHEQEMTKMGGLYPKMRITALTMLVGVLAIAGTPLFSGWYSKDAVLVSAAGFAMAHKGHVLLFLLPLITAGLTTFYMFRMWFMTFAGKPRDAHVHEHAHESPWLMTVPLIILAFFSVTVAWGWPVYDAEASWLESEMHHAQPDAVMAEFGEVGELDERFDTEKGRTVRMWRGGQPPRAYAENPREQAHAYSGAVGVVVLGVAVLAFVLAACVYYFNLLDPADAREQFPAVYEFLVNKWYFDAIYSVLLVKPALAVAGACKFFDSRVIDGAVDNTARGTVAVARGSGRFDKGIVDGLINVIADACYGFAYWLRNIQTGYLRSYVLFLVLAAVAVWIVLSSILGAAPTGK